MICQRYTLELLTDEEGQAAQFIHLNMWDVAQKAIKNVKFTYSRTNENSLDQHELANCMNNVLR